MKKFCRSCNSPKLTTVLSLGNIYLSDFVTTHQKPPKYPLTLILCDVCMLLQLRDTTPPALLYTENYGYKSGINQTMRKELEEIVSKTRKKLSEVKKMPICVDIGANDGTLLSFYPKTYERIAIEPIKKLAKEAKEHATTVINDFFNYAAYQRTMGDKKADIITAISCFYDLEEPNTFITDITRVLQQDGVFVIQQNYLVTMLSQNAFDNIVHEHVEYYSLLSLENLLSRHNLEVFDVEFSDINGGSFRTYIAFKGTRPIATSVIETIAMEKRKKLTSKSTYLAFGNRIKQIKKKLDLFLKKNKGKKIYVYGASTRGNTILQYFKLNNKIITYAVERNPEKWGKIIASVNIPIISEDQARKDNPDYLFVLPWFFKEEFLQRERSYLKNGGKFIFPLPRFAVISA